MTRSEQFKQELLQLLAKYDCELTVQEGDGHPIIEAFSRSIWNEDGSAVTRESIRIDFDYAIGVTKGK